MIVVFPSDFLSVFKGACASCGRIQPMVRRLGLCVSGSIANMLKNKDLTDTSCCVLSKMPNSQQEIKSRLSLGRFLEERGRGRTKAEARRTAFRLRLPSVSRSYLADATWCPVEPAFINRERVSFAQNDPSLHHVLQFANVSRPAVCFEQSERPPVYLLDILAGLLSVTPNEVFEQHWDVQCPLTEGR